MLIQRLLNAIQPKIITLPELVQSFGYANAAGQTVTVKVCAQTKPPG
jgi:hypothetical protein